MNRVYLHQYNAACGLGSDLQEILTNIEANQSGIKPALFAFDEEIMLPVSKFSDKTLLRLQDKGRLFYTVCFHYISQLIQSSAIDFGQDDTLLIISTTKGDIDNLAKDGAEDSLHRVSVKLQEEFHCAHQPLIISNACISGVLALIHGHDLIKTGRYQKVVVCGIDLLSNFVVSGFNILQALSPEPCKPYDINRQGVSLGEACAVALLSNEKSDIEILGGASSNDANHISGPSRDGSGLKLAIAKALEYSGVEQIDFINSHGTATLFNDEMEAKAFASLQMTHIPMNSLKAYFGHTLGAAGLLESIVSVEMMKKGRVYQSLGLEDLGISENLNLVRENKELEIKTLLKTASGFGGCNAAIVFQKND